VGVQQTLSGLRLTSAQVDFSHAEAPLTAAVVWEVEALFVKVFEYCDYSVRSALSGMNRDGAGCAVVLARQQQRLIGAAVCQYREKMPSVAIVGPVAVERKFRRMGIGTGLMRKLISFAESRGMRAIYLGVSKSNKAAELYKSLGFAAYRGVVMRYLFCPQDEFDHAYFLRSSFMKIRRAEWADFPGVCVLASSPCRMQAFDLRNGVFSSRYLEPSRFLSIFPDMMKAFSQGPGYANVLVCGTTQNVVGIAHIRSLPTEAQRHIAELDFYVHDNFTQDAEMLLQTTIMQSVTLEPKAVICYCPAGDKLKRTILENSGAHQAAVLSAYVHLTGDYDDVLVYQKAVTGNGSG